MSAAPPSPIRESIPIHTRQYLTEAFAEPDGLMRVRGRLIDTKPHGLCLADGSPLAIHDMSIDLLVDPSTFEIVRVESEMDVQPYGLCSDILATYQQLVGLSVARGYSRRVKELFGGPLGCSHMGALLIALGPVAIQASWSVHKLHSPTDALIDDDITPQEQERRLRMNTDTCHVWKAEGVHLQEIRSGTNRRRPAWEQERLSELGLEA